MTGYEAYIVIVPRGTRKSKIGGRIALSQGHIASRSSEEIRGNAHRRPVLVSGVEEKGNQRLEIKGPVRVRIEALQEQTRHL